MAKKKKKKQYSPYSRGDARKISDDMLCIGIRVSKARVPAEKLESVMGKQALALVQLYRGKDVGLLRRQAQRVAQVRHWHGAIGQRFLALVEAAL